MIKWLFWLGLLAASVVVGFKVIPVFYTNMKVQSVFEGITKNMVVDTETKVKIRLFKMLSIEMGNYRNLPSDFLDNIRITKEDDKLLIESEYHVTLWLLDKPTSVNPDEEYEEKDVKGMDKLRIKARLDFDFAPSARTP